MQENPYKHLCLKWYIHKGALTEWNIYRITFAFTTSELMAGFLIHAD